MHYLLFYEKAPDFAALQAPLQAAHRDHVMSAADSGALVLAGSLGNPDDGAALLLFEADSTATAETFAKTDPYVTGGVVSRWTVRSWDLVVGADRVASQAPAGRPRQA
ncbi:MAG: YciI family protein [Chthoniobacterales bacterium]